MLEGLDPVDRDRRRRPRQRALRDHDRARTRPSACARAPRSAPARSAPSPTWRTAPRRGWPGTTSAGSCTGSGAAHPRKPRPSTTLDSTPESTPVTRNRVCIKPGMLQCDRICRGDVLWEAWERVRENRGAAGVDRITLVAVEDYGVDRMLRELRRDLRTGRYRPAPARRVEIPKPRGGKRPLGIPTVRDRVAQAAAKLVLEPIFEADFLSCSYGFRPKRSATLAMERLAYRVHRGLPVCGRVRYRQFLRRDRPRPAAARRWVAGSRIGGCSNCCVSGCRQGCWSMGW